MRENRRILYALHIVVLETLFYVERPDFICGYVQLCMCPSIAARNAVIVVMAGGATAICASRHLQPFSASNNIPPGLPPFQVPKFTLGPPLANQTYSTDVIFRVRLNIYVKKLRVQIATYIHGHNIVSRFDNL
jgi:hypothetical protein